MTRILLTVLATLSLVGATAAPALAADSDPLQARIDNVMADFPGGTQISRNSISWDDGLMILTLDDGQKARSVQTVGSCASGSFCAWSGTSYSGDKLTLSGCSAAGTSNSLAPLGKTPRSLGNSRSSGSVSARNGTTVVYTMGPNKGIPSAASTTTNMICFS